MVLKFRDLQIKVYHCWERPGNNEKRLTGAISIRAASALLEKARKIFVTRKENRVHVPRAVRSGKQVWHGEFTRIPSKQRYRFKSVSSLRFLEGSPVVSCNRNRTTSNVIETATASTHALRSTHELSYALFALWRGSWSATRPGCYIERGGYRFYHSYTRIQPHESQKINWHGKCPMIIIDRTKATFFVLYCALMPY